MSVHRGFFSRRSGSWGTALVLAAALPVAGLVVLPPAAASAAAPSAAPAARVWSAPTKVHREPYEVSPAESPKTPTGLDQSPHEVIDRLTAVRRSVYVDMLDMDPSVIH